jgi:hypothetical protein
MLRHSLLSALTTLSLLAPAVAAQQPAQQGRRDSAAVANPAASSAALYAQAQADGRLAAASVGTGGWAIGGFFVGLIGTGVSWALAGSSGVELPPDKRLHLASQPIEYQQAYEKSFADKVRSKRKSSALTNGLLGTSLFLTIFFSATSGY